MLFLGVEISADVVDGNKVGVVEGNLFGTGEDQVLGNLDTQPSDTIQKNFHRHKLALSFMTIHSKLP